MEGGPGRGPSALQRASPFSGELLAALQLAPNGLQQLAAAAVFVSVHLLLVGTLGPLLLQASLNHTPGLLLHRLLGHLRRVLQPSFSGSRQRLQVLPMLPLFALRRFLRSPALELLSPGALPQLPGALLLQLLVVLLRAAQAGFQGAPQALPLLLLLPDSASKQGLVARPLGPAQLTFLPLQLTLLSLSGARRSLGALPADQLRALPPLLQALLPLLQVLLLLQLAQPVVPRGAFHPLPPQQALALRQFPPPFLAALALLLPPPRGLALLPAPATAPLLHLRRPSPPALLQRALLLPLLALPPLLGAHALLLPLAVGRGALLQQQALFLVPGQHEGGDLPVALGYPAQASLGAHLADDALHMLSGLRRVAQVSEAEAAGREWNQSEGRRAALWVGRRRRRARGAAVPG